MKEMFFIFSDSKAEAKDGISLEFKDNRVEFSLWEKSSAKTVKLDVDSSLKLAKELIKIADSVKLPKSKEVEIMREWEKYIVEMHTAPNPEEIKLKEKEDEKSN